MNKADVVWHEEDESIVLQDNDGWALYCVINHFQGYFWYEIKCPNGAYLPETYNDIYDAIDAVNIAKQKNI